VVGRQNADIADTLHLRDIAMATTFWLSMGYNFGCMIASDMLFDFYGWVFGVKLSNEDIADFKVLRDVAMATIFWLSIYGVHIGATWRIRLNHSCAAALCQITLDHLLLLLLFISDSVIQNKKMGWFLIRRRR